jgi:formylglycine-generating enzyme required for sulfatase activity
MQTARLILIALTFLSASVALAQGLAVEAFTPLPNDMAARTLAPERDANGGLTALIKVVTAESGFEFEGGSLGIAKVEPKTAEIWVYVPAGARTITIKHPQLGILRNYAYPVAIEAGNVYEMKLTHGELEVKVKERQIVTEFVIITSEPSGADVYLNNEPVGKTPFQAEKPEGRYEWRVVRDLYLAEAGVFELKSGEKQKLSLQLKPNYGTLEVISVPEAGATIAVNGFKTGKSTPATLEEVPSGEQTLTLTHAWYETTTQKVTVVAGKSEQVRITMQPNFAELTIEAKSDEEVYLNDSRKGKGTVTERLAPGVYRVEVRKAGHTPASKQLTLSPGDKESLSLTPTPILSTLKVLSEPMEADIYLNGKLVGTTPQILRDLLVGDYELELRKAGYGSTKQTVTVKEGQTVEVNLTLASTGSIAFTSEPSGADLYLNGTYKGRTPYTASDLPAGSYTYELRKEGYETLSASAVVDAGKTAQIYKLLSSSRKAIEPEMVRVEGGTFTMGCTSEQGGDCYDSEKPTHQVTVSGFQMGKYEVTQAQWRVVMGNNPSSFSGCDDCPVENVSWNDAQAYIAKLNQQTGKKYRLPTEAEWEFAARGGNKSKGSKYAGGTDIGSVAWYSSNSSSKTHAVGEKQANELGIYDMSGNVWEWCEDWYGDYSSSPQTNPKGPQNGSYRVLRGGSLYYDAKYCRVSYRDLSNPDLRFNYGFRLVLP